MNIQDIFRAIEKSSEEIINGNNDIPKRIKSAKNYIANSELNSWAYTKLVATEKFDINYGSEAKPFFINHNFRNILDITDCEFKQYVINQFIKWCKNINYFKIDHKFNTDQESTKRFELLIHVDQIPLEILDKENLFKDNQEKFFEGFKRQIIQENSYRNAKLINLAKRLHGTTCFICKFNFAERYGQHGKGFIEMHHLISISKGIRESSINDLIPVCANCHRMLHKGETVLSPSELQRIIEQNSRS